MFDFHGFAISFIYHKVEKIVANGSDGSNSGKASPSGIFQVTNVIKINNQLK